MPRCNHHENKNKRTVTKIPGKLWGEIRPILPTEKLNNTIGRPIIPSKKVLDGIVYILRNGCQWKTLLPKEYCSGSTSHLRFQEWVRLGLFKKMWISLLKLYDNKKGIKWIWQQSPDSISIKSPLWGR